MSDPRYCLKSLIVRDDRYDLLLQSNAGTYHLVVSVDGAKIGPALSRDDLRRLVANAKAGREGILRTYHFQGSRFVSPEELATLLGPPRIAFTAADVEDMTAI